MPEAFSHYSGFVVLAPNPRTPERAGASRGMFDILAEDSSASFALAAAQVDTRIKVVATSAMYDISGMGA